MKERNVGSRKQKLHWILNQDAKSLGKFSCGIPLIYPPPLLPERNFYTAALTNCCPSVIHHCQQNKVQSPLCCSWGSSSASASFPHHRFSYPCAPGTLGCLQFPHQPCLCSSQRHLNNSSSLPHPFIRLIVSHPCGHWQHAKNVLQILDICLSSIFPLCPELWTRCWYPPKIDVLKL